MSDHHSKDFIVTQRSKTNKKTAMSQERDHDGELTGTDETKTSEKEIKEPTAAQGLVSLLKSSWLNILLICIPFGWASHFIWTPTTTFVLNFIAIIPLAKLLGFATEEIALRTGEVRFFN